MEACKYTRIDVVNATPMTFGKFSLENGTECLDGAFKPNTCGYAIERDGEPMEWCAKKDFESKFIRTSDHIDQMKFERQELQNRINTYKNYLGKHQDDVLLALQCQIMESYLTCLNERISIAERANFLFL